jgi:spectinomycin phosphotransferase
MIVCHTDLHAGNFHITPKGKLYIVDWDQPLLAPKERDLMYVGGALMASGLKPNEEEELFYEAYGKTQLNYTARAYYRYERIIQDIYEYCTMFFVNNNNGEEDRAQYLVYLKSNFIEGGTIDVAYQTDKTQNAD